MKVLMLGWELPPYHTGGMGVMCYQLCKQLSKNNVDIEFILPFSADFSYIKFMKVNPALPIGVEEVLYNAGGSTYDSQYFTYVLKKGGVKGAHMDEHQLNYVNYVTNLVKYQSYDLIHAHDWITFRAGLAARQVCGKPLIVHVHATEFDRSGGHPNPLIEEIEYVGLHLADRIIAVSDITKQTIIKEYGIDPKKITVVHNNFEFEPEILQEQGSMYAYLDVMRAHGYRVVLSAGRLTVQKGLYNYLFAAKKALEKQPKILFVIVGGGEQYNELIALSAELGISQNVIMVGYLNGSGRAWRDAFRSADLFVMPSVSEPFGLTPFEALTYGSPILISKQSGVSEVLKNCLKVDFWDIDEMANKIVAVVNNSGLRQELHNNGTKELAQLTWDPSISKLMNVYNQHLLAGAAA